MAGESINSRNEGSLSRSRVVPRLTVANKKENGTPIHRNTTLRTPRFVTDFHRFIGQMLIGIAGCWKDSIWFVLAGGKGGNLIWFGMVLERGPAKPKMGKYAVIQP
jgi:hypothetical protein